MNVKIDSRKVEKGDTFVALRGVDNDGHNFIEKATENGAAKIVAEYGEFSVPTENANIYNTRVPGNGSLK